MSDQSRDDPVPEYKVGYGRPPKQYQFKPREPGAPPQKRGPRIRGAPDLSAILEKPLPLTREGKQAKVHPHEVMMTELGKDAVAGKIRSAREFLRQCEKAELLVPTKPFRSVHCVPHGFPWDVYVRLVEEVPEPWPDHVVKAYLKIYTPPPGPIDILIAEMEGQDER